MAKKEEEENLTKAIEKHKKMYSHANDLLNTVKTTHMEAYTGAVRKHLEEDGIIKYDKLEDVKTQNNFAQTMIDTYLSRAKSHFKISKDLNDLEKDILMQAYAGVTTGLIKQQVKQGKKFKTEQMYRLSEKIDERLREQLYASAGSHIEQEHVSGIIKHIGLEDKLDPAKIEAQEASNLLRIYQEERTIGQSILDQFPKYKHAKPKDDKKKAA